MKAALAGLALLSVAGPAWADTALVGCIKRDMLTLDDRISSARDVADAVIRGCINRITKGTCLPGACQEAFVEPYLPLVTGAILRQRAAVRSAQ